MRHIPVLAMVLAAVWMGISYLADHAHTKELTKEYVETLVPRVKKLDPWLLSTSFLKREACAASGNCPGCQTALDRITSIDCEPEPPQPLLGTFARRHSSKNSGSVLYFLPALPVSALHALKQAWSGGPLGFIPAVSSWFLAYFGLLVYDQKFGRARGWQLDLGARLLWSFPLGALLQWTFQCVFLGTLALLGSIVALLAYLYYVLFALEVYLKVRHSAEFLERAKATHVRNNSLH